MLRRPLLAASTYLRRPFAISSRSPIEELHYRFTKLSAQPSQENFIKYLQELNAQQKFTQVTYLRKQKENEKYLEGMNKSRVMEEYKYAECCLSRSSEYSRDNNSKQHHSRGGSRSFMKRVFLFYLFFSVFEPSKWKQWLTLAYWQAKYERFNQSLQKITEDLKDRIKRAQEGGPRSIMADFKIEVFERVKPEDIEQNLSDLKGLDECVQEIEDVVNFLKYPEKYIEKGAKLPKGLLLYGEPGVGKTMLARAIAKEAGVTFLYQNGSSFDEIYVGSGTIRVQQLFSAAKKAQPAIIFIDEIDSLLSKARRKHESSYSRATINLFLSEMDGFEQSQNVLVIGATNQLDNLDDAATRAGRFDMKIHVPKPDEKGRADIMKFYLDKISHHKDIDPNFWAKITAGMSPVEIKNLVNTAICDAVHDKRYIARISDFDQARDKLMMGLQRKSMTMSDMDRLRTSIHEIGHTMACLHTPGALKLEKVTIIPRGMALGVTIQMNDEAVMRSMSKQNLMANIDVAMGGHIAEKIFIGDYKITSGCGSDLQKATQLAKMAVKRFGMDGSFMALEQQDLSEATKDQQDACVRRILQESYERVFNLLLSRNDELRLIAKELYCHDTLSVQDIRQLQSGKRLKQKMRVRKWTRQLQDFYQSMKKDLKKKSGKKGSPPIVETLPASLFHEEKPAKKKEQKSQPVFTPPNIGGEKPQGDKEEGEPQTEPVIGDGTMVPIPDKAQ